MRLEARRVTARCEMINCLAKQIATEVGGFCILSRSFSPPQTGDLRQKNRTTKAQGFCTPIPPRPAYPSREREAADPLAGVGVPVWFPNEKRARCQRLSVRVGAMVAELSF